MKGKQECVNENLRKETWIHPRLSLDSHNYQESSLIGIHSNNESSEEDNLESLGPAEVKVFFVDI